MASLFTGHLINRIRYFKLSGGRIHPNRLSQSEMEYGSYREVYETIPIRALHDSCRQKLSMALNPSMPLPSSNGFSRNWMGLVELIGFSYETVKLLRQRECPTMALLELWEADDSDPTIAKLLEYLQTIERFDVIDDILPLLERDSQSYLNREEARRRKMMPIQDASISSARIPTISCPITMHDVLRSHTLHEGMAPSKEQNSIEDDKYDAYVSYVDSDIDFVTTLMEKMEGEYKLRLFIKGRDMLAGIPEAEADITMINERCERILLIISPDFLSDPQCEFTTMFSQALAVDNNLYARKVIPVIVKPCELPVRLKYIARVDYTKKDFFGKFWERLYFSIKSPIQGDDPRMGATGMRRLCPNHLVGDSGGLATCGRVSPTSADAKERISVKALTTSNLTLPECSLTTDKVESNFDSGIELESISNSNLSAKGLKSKGMNWSAVGRRKFFHSTGGFFSRGTNSKANTE